MKPLQARVATANLDIERLPVSFVQRIALSIAFSNAGYLSLIYVFGLDLDLGRQVFIGLVAALLTLFLLQVTSLEHAVRVGIVGLWLSLIDISFSSPYGSTFAVSGFIILMLSTALVLPDRSWLLVMIATLVGVTASNVRHILAANDSLIRQNLIEATLQQAVVIVVGATFVISIHRYNMQLTSRVAQANAELLEQTTVLKEAQTQLNHSTKVMRHVIEHIPARLYYNTPEGVVLFTNANELHTQTGLPVVGHNTKEFTPRARWLEFEPHVERARRGLKSQIDVRRTLETRGETVERFQFFPHIMDGTVEGIFVIGTDITELQKLERAVAQTQKLESLGLLAGGIAHDFNNLLAAIMGQISLAQARLDSSHVSQKHILRALDASRRAASLTQQMLAYSGNGAFVVAPIDINELVEKNSQLFEVSLPTGVEIVTELGDGLKPILADASQIQQLIMNLVINAGQAFDGQSGQVYVRTWSETLDADLDARWEITGDPIIPGDYLHIQVEDTGIGMDKKTIATIFDPFFTTKESGTGLGLAAAIGIVRGHSGGIQLNSEVGVGTTFDIYFPQAKSAEPIKQT